MNLTGTGGQKDEQDLVLSKADALTKIFNKIQNKVPIVEINKSLKTSKI